MNEWPNAVPQHSSDEIGHKHKEDGKVLELPAITIPEKFQSNLRIISLIEQMNELYFNLRGMLSDLEGRENSAAFTEASALFTRGIRAKVSRFDEIAVGTEEFVRNYPLQTQHGQFPTMDSLESLDDSQYESSAKQISLAESLYKRLGIEAKPERREIVKRLLELTEEANSL